MDLLNRKVIDKNTKIEYICVWLFYVLNCILYGRDTILYMLLGLIISLLLLSFVFIRLKKKYGLIVASLSLLIITLPVSFRSIFCTGYDRIPIPWFYLILFLWFFIALVNRIQINTRILFLLFCLLIPMFLSNNLFEGFKEYLGYASFCIGGLIAYGNRNAISRDAYSIISNFYINGIVFTAIGIIIQFIFLNFLGIELFRIESYAFGRKLLMFLYYDMSGITVYMATGVIFLLLSQKKLKIILSLLIAFSMALTSARAGIFSLLIIIVLVVIFEKRNVKKLPIISFGCIAGIGTVSILLATRKSFSSIWEMLFQDNGRNGLIQVALREFLRSPILGCGLDFGIQMKAQGEAVPHNAIINLLAQTGIFITLIFLVELINCLYFSYRFNNKVLFWCCVLGAVGSCVSPSFFDLRFFTVIFMLCYLGPNNIKRLADY